MLISTSVFSTALTDLIPLSLATRGSCYSCKSFKKFNVLCLFSTKHTICERLVNTAEHLLAMELHISLRRWLRGKNESRREWLLDSDFPFGYTRVSTCIVLTHAALLIHTGYSDVYCMLMLMVFGMYSQLRAKEGKKIGGKHT